MSKRTGGRTWVTVDKRAARSVRAGHPWIWPDAISGTTRLHEGAEIEVRDVQGSFLARALAEGPELGTGPALRIITRDARDPELGRLLFRRISAARRLRERCVAEETTGFRLVHGEADDLPGLVVDRYDTTLVVKLDTQAWEPHLSAVATALKTEGGRRTDHIIYRQDNNVRNLFGERAPEQVTIREDGRDYLVRPGGGQKTGFFLDQRPNRNAVQDLTRPGDRALNLFSYTGGFSVALALGGAQEVVSVDASASILEDCEAQFPLNDLDSKQHRFLSRDLFRDLPRLAEEERSRPFQVIVCDPPALARRKADLDSARRAYRRLHKGLGPMLAKEGVLVTASCTARLGHVELLEDARAGLAESGRKVLRVLQRGEAGSDHPVSTAFPEGRYLSCLWLLVG
ncbi:MAG TPA: class I SAM-dependent rRNA methyltransferase [Deltaproteobacteria bacterium]|nr:pseudouridine synthase [Deltaproteobacteria bacterium]HCP47301.1 class I SAM-dependent rRNA methyltransferase [Deltaproteobacteria bacterium]